MGALVSEARLRHRFAANVRRLRGEQGLTQEQAAERADLDPRFYQRCEYGEANAPAT